VQNASTIQTKTNKRTFCNGEIKSRT